MKKNNKQSEKENASAFIEFKREGVVVKDIVEWTNKIIELRNLETENITVQLGFDVGQGVLKVMQTIKLAESNDIKQHQKRRKYSNGYEDSKAPLSSVKKLFISCAVPQVNESCEL